MRPLDEQLAEYRLQFELTSELETWEAANPKPYVGRLPLDLAIMSDWETARSQLWDSLLRRGWNRQRWHWDEQWDGGFLADVVQLDRTGLKVQQFWRKRRVNCRLPADLTRGEVVKLILNTVGDQWIGIQFKRGHVSIWWSPDQYQDHRA